MIISESFPADPQDEAQSWLAKQDLSKLKPGELNPLTEEVCLMTSQVVTLL